MWYKCINNWCCSLSKILDLDLVEIWYVLQDGKYGVVGETLWWIKYDNEKLVIILYANYHCSFFTTKIKRLKFLSPKPEVM
jgi:hypothetical protein